LRRPGGRKRTSASDYDVGGGYPRGTKGKPVRADEDRAGPVKPDEFRRAAEFRVALRAFHRRTEEITAAHRLTPQRYLVLLAIKGAPDGREDTTVTELAERLLLGQNTMTELIGRMEEAGLLTRETSVADRRVAHLRLTPDAEERLESCFRDLGSERARLRDLLAALP
jgi:DNA-binding MarR family transcriptional regulator